MRGERAEVISVFGWALLAALLMLHPAEAADHEDAPAVRTDPSTDFGDVMAWTSPDATRLNLIATVVRRATAASRFSDAADYVFHTRSAPSFGGSEAREINITCTFEGTTTQIVTCEGGGSSVTGDASNPAGITSADGRIRVFAGLRNDAFFFNSDGFNAVRGAVISAAPSLVNDAAGCPGLDGATATALQTTLRRGMNGGPPTDNFGGANILVLALSVDKSIVTPGGPIVAVYGSTDRR